MSGPSAERAQDRDLVDALRELIFGYAPLYNHKEHAHASAIQTLSASLVLGPRAGRLLLVEDDEVAHASRGWMRERRNRPEVKARQRAAMKTRRRFTGL